MVSFPDSVGVILLFAAERQQLRDKVVEQWEILVVDALEPVKPLVVLPVLPRSTSAMY